MHKEKTWFAREKMKEIYEKNNEDSSTAIEYWHYTSMSAILGIFKSFIDSPNEEVSTIDLYASHNRFLNDSQEYEDGKQCLIDFVDKYNNKKKETVIEEAVANTDANVYIVSFCREGDLLSQWKWYGGESGISFCFNADKAAYSIQTEVDQDGKADKNVIYDVFTRPLPVCYSHNEKESYFINLIENILVKPRDKTIDETKIDLLPELFIPFCKNESFHEEKEHRLVFFDYDDLSCREGHKISFNNKYNKASNGVVKPSLNVKVVIDDDDFDDIFSEHALKDVEESVSAHEKPSLITKMIVGPGANQHLYFNSLIHIFDRNHFRFQPDPNTQEEKSKYHVYKEYEELPIGELFYIDDTKEELKDYTYYKLAYKCHNGLLIMKSAIPFRG